MKPNKVDAGHNQATGRDGGLVDARHVASANHGTHSAVMQAVRQTLQAWRERGYDRLDPARFHVIEAFAARAAGYGGAAQAVMQAKLSAMLQTYEALVASRAPLAADVAQEAGSLPGGPLAELVAGMRRPASGGEPAGSNGIAARPAASYPELPVVDYFQATWARLRTRRQLQASQALVPENAGPLNSNSLVHRALSLMREVSPDYLQHFLTYVDTLSWLEQADVHAGAAAKGREASPAKGRKMPSGR